MFTLCCIRKFRLLDRISVLVWCPKIARRRCFALELDSIYCDVDVRRWELATGKVAQRLLLAEGGNLKRECCDEAGLPECSAHGFRKACARRLEEARGTAPEIMAVTGHKTLAEVQRYTETAMREGLVDSAHAKLLSRPNREQTVVNIPQRFAKKSTNALKINEK